MAPPPSADKDRYHLVYRYAHSRLAAQYFEQDQHPFLTLMALEGALQSAEGTF